MPLFTTPATRINNKFKKPNSTLSMRIATWNVRTMRIGLPITCGGSGDAEELRKTAIIDAELNRLRIDVAALQETRLPDEGSIKERNYTFFWKGKDVHSVREHGTGFAIRNSLLNSIEAA